MRRFAELYEAIDSTTSTNAKVDALARYFSSADPNEAGWAVFFLTGRRLKRLLPSASYDAWTAAMTGLPDWLLSECYAASGDYAEAVTLLVGQRSRSTEELSLSAWIQRLQSLPDLDEAAQLETVKKWWTELDRRELFLLLKLITGELRVGVSETLVLRGLAQATGVPSTTLAHRLMGTWEPGPGQFQRLVAQDVTADDLSKPYPFCLASPLDRPVEELGALEDWLVEWKWDGIRGQLIRRRAEAFLWSRGEELITHRFPEIIGNAARLPDGTVLDGEVLAYRDGAPMRFSVLQTRIGRQKLSDKILTEAPAVFMAYDLLEDGGVDLREGPISERRARLAERIRDLPTFLLSPRVEAKSWEELAELRTHSRERNVEGFLLKRWGSPYQTGRKKGDWWKWKIDPFSIDAVLIYAQPGNGRRATLFTDYTFGVWENDELLPIAKAYSGLSDEEIARLDAWVRQHTLERFGPVSRVEPVHVFELHFEALAPSTRHKSGIAVRFPRIARWRTDKKPQDADTLENVRALARAANGSTPA